MDFSSWSNQYPALSNLSSTQPGALNQNMFQGWDFTGANGPAAAAAGNTAATTAVQPGQFQFGANMPTVQAGLGALTSLAGLFQGMQANKLARDQFRFTRDVTNTNLNNSITSYNTALSDRANARAKTQGDSDAERDSYVAANRLSRG